MERRGSRGSPLGLPPPLGIDGVTLIDSLKEWKVTGFPLKIMIIRYNERRLVIYPCDERRRPRRGPPAAVYVTKKMLKPPCPAMPEERP